MAFSLIVIIILTGIVLVLLEIFVVPGTTLVGFLGGIAMVTGVILAYVTQDNVWLGHGTLAGTTLATVALGFLAVRAFRDSQYTLHDVLDGQVNVREDLGLKPGDTGEAVTDLRPGGKVLFGDVKLEVFSQGDFLDAGSPVVITKITNNRVYVKLA